MNKFINSLYGRISAVFLILLLIVLLELIHYLERIHNSKFISLQFSHKFFHNHY